MEKKLSSSRMLFIFKLQEVKIHLPTICFKRATVKKKKTQKIGIAGNTTSPSLNPTKITRKMRRILVLNGSSK
jgi:hypothetical protein